MTLKNKNIILLGGSGLIGSAIAKELVRNNCNVFIFDKQKPSKKNNFSQFVKIDFKNISLFEKKIKLIAKNRKKIHAVINCAYLKDKNWGKKFHQLNTKEIKRNLFFQLGVPLLQCKIVLKLFDRQKFGNLILFSSIFGVSPPKFEHYKNTEMTVPIEYATSKAGIISMTKYLAKLYGRKNIRVNCVSPGGVEDNQPILFKKKYRKSCLNKGLLSPKDLTGLIKFLLSEESKYVNGQNIIIDDGWTL